jgi:dTDP-4-amino-4,6-dideoxygalactose transaminase
MLSEIPFNKPFLTGTEVAYVSRAIASSGIATDGHFTQSCAQLLKQRFAMRDVFMVTSCSAALEMAAMLCGLGPGDEVILPSFTFASTANAVARLGARPVFVDIRADTLNLDESRIEASLTRRSRAIFPVHYAGVACEMDCLMAIARRHDLLVVEDAAQAVNAFYKGRALGTIGDFGAYSFHSTKDYTGGEGGALSLGSPATRSRAEIIRDKGTDRSKFLRGEVDKYTWVDLGSSYTPSELSCAFLYGQLEAMDDIRDKRRRIFERYREGLSECEERGWLLLARVPADCQPNYHMCYILLPDESTRDRLMGHISANGIRAHSHYTPLHCSPMGQRYGYCRGDLPLTEELSSRLLRLPFFPALRQEDQLRVMECVGAYFRGASSTSVGASKSARPVCGAA